VSDQRRIHVDTIIIDEVGNNKTGENMNLPERDQRIAEIEKHLLNPDHTRIVDISKLDKIPTQ